MARKTGSTISQEELYPQTDEPVREVLDDARLLDLDVEEESPFLRGQKRVSVRRGSLPKKTATRLTWTAFGLGVLAFCGIIATALYQYGEHSWRFRIDSSDNIEINGLGDVTRSQVMEVMGEDIGRNIFFVPLGQRQRQLEQIPWVESASVMRFVPNRLRIEIHERTPVAFARIGSRISLIDAGGTLMEPPIGRKKKFSFPVILGMNLSEPQSTRAARMKMYNQLVSELDSSGAHYSQDLNEVDLSDSEDVKVLASDAGGEVLVHLGSSDFLDRFKIYVSHVQEWRQQFSRLDSVDLRYEHQIIVNPDLQGTAKQPALPQSTARAALAEGVKPAALTTREHPQPAVGATIASLKPALKAASARKKTARTHHRKPLPAKITKSTTASATPQSGSTFNPVQHATSTGNNPVAPGTANTAKPSNKPSAGIPKEQSQ
ncbi:MAG: FtsQ-type POTRA domain-containing protein [Terriglobales bacterium]